MYNHYYSSEARSSKMNETFQNQSFLKNFLCDRTARWWFLNKTENHFSPYPRLRKKFAINCGIGLHKNNSTSLNLSAGQQRAHANNESMAWWNWTKNKFKPVRTAAARACSLVTCHCSVVQCGDCGASEHTHQIRSKLVELPGKAAGQACRARLLNAWWNWTIRSKLVEKRN
jgi:hypothetical protein